jgi:hypothetical protein
MSNVLRAARRPDDFGFVGLLVLLIISLWLARRAVRRTVASIRLGPPKLVPLAADQAVVAAQLLATTLAPWLSGDDPEALE